MASNKLEAFVSLKLLRDAAHYANAAERRYDDIVSQTSSGHGQRIIEENNRQNAVGRLVHAQRRMGWPEDALQAMHGEAAGIVQKVSSLFSGYMHREENAHGQKHGACVKADGTLEFWEHGRLHNDAGPAVISPDGWQLEYWHAGRQIGPHYMDRDYSDMEAVRRKHIHDNPAEDIDGLLVDLGRLDGEYWDIKRREEAVQSSTSGADLGGDYPSGFATPKRDVGRALRRTMEALDYPAEAISAYLDQTVDERFKKGGFLLPPSGHTDEGKLEGFGMMRSGALVHFEGGELHRENGPAQISPAGTAKFALRGEAVDREKVMGAESRPEMTA